MTISFKRRRESRLAAVQAIYQLEQMQNSSEAVIQQFLSHYEPHFQEEIFDIELFQELVTGTQRNLQEIDTLIESVLNTDWRLERLDAVLRSILRIGFFELNFSPLTPVAILINDYVEIAKQFFEGRESGFINSALDAGAKVLRKEREKHDGP